MFKFRIPEGRRPLPKIAIITIILLGVAAIALVIFIGIQQPDSSTQAGAFEFVQVTQEYLPGEDVVIGVNNTTLHVPSYAIQIPGSFAIFSLEPNLFTPPNDKIWARPLVVNVEFRNGEGKPVPVVNFARPAEICFKITRQRWIDYTLHPNQYEVQTYAEEKAPPVWENLPLVAYPDRLQLCGQINHLSVFALATKPEITMPEILIPISGPTPILNPSEELLNTPSDNSTNTSPNNSSEKRSKDVYEP